MKEVIRMVNFEVRGGAGMRKRTAAIGKQKSSKYACPRCGKKAVKRAGNSLWQCRSCGAEFAGGAYSLSTAVGDAARRLMENVRKGAKPKA